MATHSSVLAWRIPGMEEPGWLPSMGLQRVGHDWSNLAAAAAGRPYLPSFYNMILGKAQKCTVCICINTHLLDVLGFIYKILTSISGSYIHTWIISLFNFSSVQVCSVAQSCPTRCDPMDCSLPGSSIPGILQARVLEWGAIAFSHMDARGL